MTRGSVAAYAICLVCALGSPAHARQRPDSGSPALNDVDPPAPVEPDSSLMFTDWFAAKLNEKVGAEARKYLESRKLGAEHEPELLLLGVDRHLHVERRLLAGAGDEDGVHASVPHIRSPCAKSKPMRGAYLPTSLRANGCCYAVGPIEIQFRPSRKWWFGVTRSAAYFQYVSTGSAPNRHVQAGTG